MSARAGTAVALVVGAALMAFGLRGGPAPAAPSDATVFKGVRVFDGERVIQRASVLISGGRIQAVGDRVDAPAGARVVEGRGKTLLPGLIDAHTHAFGDALERALAFGVTTELDMFTDHALAARLRREQQDGKAAARADLLSAGTLVTAPGGHGTEYGVKIPTLVRPEDADAFVEARLLEGSDYVKAVFDDGGAYGLRWPTLDRATLEAVVRAARKRKRLAVVHVGSAAGARGATLAGADGLVHLFADAAPAPDFAKLVKDRGAFVIPTLSVVDSLAATRGGAAFAEDRKLAEWLRPAEILSLKTGFPLGTRRPRLDPEIPRRVVRELAAAGVPILAGTDAPNPGTAHGASIHRELELLVAAGLTPAQALAAATSVPARLFGLADRGRIAAGLRADLLLVDGDPTSEVNATRSIEGIWKGGVAVTRTRPGKTAVARIDDGRVSDFEQDVVASFGAGWHVSTDDMLGGKSEARMERTDAGALRVTGNLRSGSPYPWAGAIFFPGPGPMLPADLSAFHALRFRVRGDGKSYRVMAFATHLGQIPVSAEFVAGRDWAVVEMPFASLSASLDGSDLTGVLFTAGPDEGEFRFEIDDVSFVKKP